MLAELSVQPYNMVPAAECRLLAGTVVLSYVHCSVLDRIVGHNEGRKSTGAIGYFCPGTAKSTGAVFPLPLWRL